MARGDRYERQFVGGRFKCPAAKSVYLKMSILYVLIPLALLILGGAVWAFFWAVGSGQFDDLDTPAVRILMDDDKAPKSDSDE